MNALTKATSPSELLPHSREASYNACHVQPHGLKIQQR